MLIKGPLDGLVHPTSAVKFVASEIPIRSSMSKQYGGYMALNWFWFISFHNRLGMMRAVGERIEPAARRERGILFGPVAACWHGGINDLPVICNCFKLVYKRNNKREKAGGEGISMIGREEKTTEVKQEDTHTTLSRPWTRPSENFFPDLIRLRRKLGLFQPCGHFWGRYTLLYFSTSSLSYLLHRARARVQHPAKRNKKTLSAFHCLFFFPHQLKFLHFKKKRRPVWRVTCGASLRFIILTVIVSFSSLPAGDVIPKSLLE